MATRNLTALPNGLTTSRDELMQTIAARYAPVLYTVPDYDTRVEVAIVSAGDEEHCAAFARSVDGERNWDIFARLWVGYALIQPKLAEDPDRRVEAEKVAAVLEEFPKDWIELIFAKTLEMTNEYRRKRAAREREEARGGTPVVFPRHGSAPSSSATDSASSIPASSP
jgi:hypothetical protein